MRSLASPARISVWEGKGARRPLSPAMAIGRAVARLRLRPHHPDRFPLPPSLPAVRHDGRADGRSHPRLDTGGLTTAPRKQAVRMLKCECQACGYTVRTARKWLETAGAPLCPIPGHGAMRHEPLDGDEEPEG